MTLVDQNSTHLFPYGSEGYKLKTKWWGGCGKVHFFLISGRELASCLFRIVEAACTPTLWRLLPLQTSAT